MTESCHWDFQAGIKLNSRKSKGMKGIAGKWKKCKEIKGNERKWKETTGNGRKWKEMEGNERKLKETEGNEMKEMGRKKPNELKWKEIKGNGRKWKEINGYITESGHWDFQTGSNYVNTMWKLCENNMNKMSHKYKSTNTQAACSSKLHFFFGQFPELT